MPKRTVSKSIWKYPKPDLIDCVEYLEETVNPTKPVWRHALNKLIERERVTRLVEYISLDRGWNKLPNDASGWISHGVFKFMIFIDNLMSHIW